MKTHKDVGRKLFRISMFCFLISSITVFFVGLIPEGTKGLSQAGMVIGILFWLGILLGILFFVLSWRRVKDDDEYEKLRSNTKPGYISFGKTKYGIITDCLVLVFLIVTILGNTAVHFPDVVMMFCLFILIYSFCLRFLMNGRVYRYISNHKQGREGERNEG